MSTAGERTSHVFIYTILCCFGLLGVAGHREHKVHNIVLYPDKHSWCTTLAIKQVISYPGCHSEEIDNNVCVGACFSYSIPHTEPSDPGEVIVPYCDSCQPSETKWHHVTLKCNGGDIGQQGQLNEKQTILEKVNSTKMTNGDSGGGFTPTHQLVKRVQIITNCSCSSCESTKNQRSTVNAPSIDMGDLNNYYNDVNHGASHRDNHNGGDDDMESGQQHQQSQNQQDVPDLLNVLKSPRSDMNTSALSDADAVKSMLNNHKLIMLLQNIQEKNSKYDKAQLMEVLRLLQSDDDDGNVNSISGGKKLSDKSIAEFVESLNTEHIELDMKKLREVLTKFENSHIFEKHRKFGLGGGESAEDHQNDEDDDEDGDSENGINEDQEKHQHFSQIGEGIEGSHHGLGHLKGAHIGLGLHAKSIVQNDDTTNNNNNNNNNNKHHGAHHAHNVHSHYHHQHHQHKNHHVGEKVSHVGHLTRGPHGALVIQPENDDKNSNNESSTSHNHHSTSTSEKHVEKLNVNPHELKPNHAGTLMSYTSHHGKVQSHDAIDSDVGVADVDVNDNVADAIGGEADDDVNDGDIVAEKIISDNSSGGGGVNTTNNDPNSNNHTEENIQIDSHNRNNRNNHDNLMGANRSNDGTKLLN